jgi:hypothetical protein
VSSAREAEKRLCYSSFKSSVVRYFPDSSDVSTEAAESPSLRSVTTKRLVKAG